VLQPTAPPRAPGLLWVVKKNLCFLEFEAGPLLCVQEPATCLCPQPDEPIARRSLVSLGYILILSSHLRLGLTSG
jgi:hypothetical protein